ncbi:MAG: Uma2 family endonuclease [Herpetosiphonaceae bacterium]|nr:Uma2 family endonuclease [Herpetosiphonaceae bacterium]
MVAGPDLAVEVVSPSESAQDINEKVRDYLAAGTQLMWVVYPRTRQVIVYGPSNAGRIYTVGDTLEHADVLPGFRCPVAELFT